MLCPSCNKFAAQSADSEPELELNLDEDTGSVTGSARIVVTSECCGEELKEAVFDSIEIDLEDAFKDCIKARDADPETPEGQQKHEFEIVSESGEITERYETTKKTVRKDGTVVEKPVPSRYQTHYYGVSITVEVKCSCGVSATGTYEDEVPAGGMEELI